MSEKETRPDAATGPVQDDSEKRVSDGLPSQPALSAAEADWFRDLATMSLPASEGAGDGPAEAASSDEQTEVAPVAEADSGVPERAPIRARLSALFRRRRTGPSAPDSAEVSAPDGAPDERPHDPQAEITEITGTGELLPSEPVSRTPPDESIAGNAPGARKRGVPALRLFRAKRERPIETAPEQATDVSDRTEGPAGDGDTGPVAPGPDAPPPLVQRLKGGLGRGDLVTRGLRGARAEKRSREPKGKGADKARGYPPIQVILGWIEESSRKDVLEHARGFAGDHIETLETAWIAMAEFRGGTLFEIHEGGGGFAYLPELIEGMSRDPDQILWVPSGMKMNRVVTLSIVEGRPFSMMLNEADSARVRASGQLPVERTGRMKRLQPRGTPVLVLGATLFGLSFAALSASAYLSIGIDQQPIPSLSYNPENLPHAQIVTLSDALREDRWVSRIQFENGTWRAEFETFDELILPDDTGEAQRIIDEAVERDGVLQEERERKIREIQGR